MLFLAYSPLFEAIRRYSRTRMSRGFLIQGISYNRMRTRSTLVLVFTVLLLVSGVLTQAAAHIEPRVLGLPRSSI